MNSIKGFFVSKESDEKGRKDVIIKADLPFMTAPQLSVDTVDKSASNHTIPQGDSESKLYAGKWKQFHNKSLSKVVLNK